MPAQGSRVQPSKSSLREQAKSSRNALSPTQRERYSAAIIRRCLASHRVATASCIFVYISTPEEVATHALIDHCLAAKKTVVVPKIMPRRQMSAVRFPGWDGLESGPLGTLVPTTASDPVAAATVDAVIMPGLAFTRRGTRLGYGGGYYDRWLATHPGIATIALAFETQLVEHIPTESHDVAMHQIVTENRTIVINER